MRWACCSGCLNIFRAKTNKLLDQVEDPRDSLDLSYEKQLENLQKMRRSVAEVATAKKRIEIQATQLQQQAAKLQDQARQALGQDREDLAREALTRRAAIGAELTDLESQHAQIADQEEKLVETAQRLQTQVARLPDPEGDHEGDLHRGRGPDPDRRGGGGHLGVDERRRADHAAGRRTRSPSMQARAGAIDELLASGALTDLSSSTDDIQAKLNKVSADLPGRAPSSPPSRPSSAAAPAAGAASRRRRPGERTRPHPLHRRRVPGPRPTQPEVTT